MPQSPSHQELESQLLQSQMGIAASELQGSLTALLGFENTLDPDQWLNETLGGDVSLYELDGQLRESLNWLFDWTAQALRQRQLDFQLLLPGDDVALEQRTAALAHWAAGYVAAVGPRCGADLQLLPDVGREYVRDLVEISRAAFRGEAAESDETQFLDLVEYTRLGAMTVFESVSQSEPANAAGFETGDDPFSDPG